jgi:cytochrome c oxidase cbb3-type subunit 3
MNDHNQSSSSGSSSGNGASGGSDQFGQLTGHEYDGIREYDNPLPGWWSWLFILTIVFSIFYFVVSTSTGQLSAVYAYQQAVVEETAKEFGSMTIKPDPPTLLMLGKNPRFHALGENIFRTNCVSCHGQHAEGMACPNLTDNYYIHVKTITDFVDVITKGRKDGAMPAWGNRLSPNEIAVVAAYVASLRGTNYPGGKAPEGTIPPPWSDH